jgi:hypothetical protein
MTRVTLAQACKGQGTHGQSAMENPPFAAFAGCSAALFCGKGHAP